MLIVNAVTIEILNCLSKLLIGIADRNCWSEFLIGIADRNFWSELLIRIADQNFWSEFLIGILIIADHNLPTSFECGLQTEFKSAKNIMDEESGV